MTTKDKRAKIVDEGIRLTWSSLESHLEWTHRKSSEGKRWHQKCVEDYVRTLQLFIKLY